MSTKHNTKHPDRGKSRYPARLKARGQTSASVRMEPLETLRVRQDRRVEATCTKGPAHDFHECNGVPFWTPSADASLADTDAA